MAWLVGSFRKIRNGHALLLTSSMFVAIAAIACLMPVHNDTWWHLRAGHDMATNRRLMFVDRFSHTADSGFFWNHSWLSQLILYAAFSIGGLAGATALCAVAVTTGWLFVYRLMRGPSDLRIVIFVLAAAASTMTWSVRPQVFSILFLPVLALLIARERWVAATLAMVLWANLHAGMAIGLIAAAAALLVALVDRERRMRRVTGAMSVALATLATPLGVRNWVEVLESLARSRANQIQEWLATPLPPAEIFFWGLAAAFIIQLLRRGSTARSFEDRVLVLLALVALPLAVRTFRNVPAFMMMAAPAFTRLTWPLPSPLEQHKRKTSSGISSAFVVFTVTTACAVAIVAFAWGTGWSRLRWNAMSPEAARAIAECPSPLYNTYEGGGPIIWFVPSQPVFVDSRQDPFPTELVQWTSRVERTGDYTELFRQWGIRCAALPPSSRTAARLRRDGWTPVFTDTQWVVLSRGASPAR